MFASTAPRRILVIANETVEGEALYDAIVAREDVEVLVVAPALNTRLRHWTSDEGRARRQAAERVASCLAALRRAGVDAQGKVGDADPMRAIEDALVTFLADELLIATHPEHRSNWLAHQLVGRVRARYPLPVGHIVVDGVRALPVLAAAA